MLFDFSEKHNLKMVILDLKMKGINQPPNEELIQFLKNPGPKAPLGTGAPVTHYLQSPGTMSCHHLQIK
jgi:hypothetical protein